MKQSEARAALDLFEIAPGRKASWDTLKSLLPDVPTALFFAKAYSMDVDRLSALVFGLFKSDLFDALSEGTHSTTLQSYIVDTIPPHVWPEGKSATFDDDAEPPKGELLPELWEAAEVEVAASLKEVAEKIAGTLDRLPSKEGRMTFQHMAKLNKQRPTLGQFNPTIRHPLVAENLVILDVSGSMTEGTIRRIVEDVVALSWKAEAHLAIVSNHTFHWEPGTYGVADVLRLAEYSGTQYETLAPLFDGRSWGTVITVADYDSSWSAAEVLARCSGSIEQVLDISLVNRPTYLAECVGQLASSVKPLLVATSGYVLSA
jgi:hypothetical protein